MIYVLYGNVKGDVTIRLFRELEPAQQAAQQLWQAWAGDDDEDYEPITGWVSGARGWAEDDDDSERAVAWYEPDASNTYYQTLADGGEVLFVIYPREVE
jgi:hypothetical protein